MASLQKELEAQEVFSRMREGSTKWQTFIKWATEEACYPWEDDDEVVREGCFWDTPLLQIADAMTLTRAEEGTTEHFIMDFAATEGWDGVMSAMAASIRRQEAKAKK